MSQIMNISFALSNKKAAFHCYIMVLLLKQIENQGVKRSFFLRFIKILIGNTTTQCYVEVNSIYKYPHRILKNKDVSQQVT